MTTTTATSLVDRQVAGLNAGDVDEVTAIYAEDATLVVVSPHTLPGSELRLAGREKIVRHMQRVIDGGIAGVTLEWVGAGEGTLAWRDTGTVGRGKPFSEAHTAIVGSDGLIVEHWIHSVYER